MRKRHGGNGGRGSGGGGGGTASLSFQAALQAQRAALAAAPAPAPPAAPAPPPALRGFVYDAHTQRHWPVAAAAGLKRRLAGSEPQQELRVAQQQRLLGTHPRASALALLRSRELRACSSSSSSSSSSSVQPSALRYLQGLLSSCVRAWEPTPPLQRLPGALAALELECTVPAALCAHPTRSGLAWNAAGGVAQLRQEAGASAWAFEAADSPVTALAWDASGSLLAHATLGGNGACASLCVAAPAAARPASASGGGGSSSRTASASAALRLPPAASVWGLAWLPDPGSDCGSTHLCLPLEAGGRAALVRRGAGGRQQQLLVERTFACGSGGRGGSDALAVGAAPQGSSASSAAAFLVGLRDGRVCLCDARAPAAPAPLARLPGPTAALSPLPSLSPYALLCAVTHCAERQRLPQRQQPPPTCTLWDVRSSRGPTAALAGNGAASFKHRPSVLAELGLVAAWAPGGGGGGAGLLQCWEAGAAGAAGSSADEPLPPTWRTWLPGSSGGGLAQVHSLAMRAVPGSGAELLLLGSAGGSEEEAAARGSEPPALVLQRFARSAARGFELEEEEEEEEGEERMGGP